MTSLLVARAARRARPAVTVDVPAWARGTLAPVLAALLALSCQRKLGVENGTVSDGGTGRRPTDGGSTGIGGNGGSTTTGVGGNGGSTTTGVGGNGGIGAVDAGRDRVPPLPDAGHDLGVDRLADGMTPTCPVDCAHLPHLRADAKVSCGSKGKCVFLGVDCENGFANCSGDADTGCETDISTVNNCGSCYDTCFNGQACKPLTSGGFLCGNPCSTQFPDACDDLCFDLKTDVNNCGTCGNGCYMPNAMFACQAGKCVLLGCSDPTFADCTSDSGCETSLGTDTDCGSCGDPVCTTANTLRTCSDGGDCTGAVCAPGFANCDTSSPDCETSVASPPAGGGSCLPQYVGTFSLATNLFDSALTAVAADGSIFLAGTFMGAVDFDPSANHDIRTANDPDGYVTKFNADGSYAWTATFAGRGDLHLNGLAVTPVGGVVATGNYQDTVDLDPGTGSNVHVTFTAGQTDGFVVELASNGTMAWGGTFAGATSDTAVNSVGVTVDGAGAVYVSGSFFGTVDFDPGTGADNLTATDAAFVVKLTSGGAFAWANAFDNGDCFAVASSVAVAKDGGVWTTGMAGVGDGCTLAPTPAGIPQDDVLLVKLDPTIGNTLSLRTFGNVFEGFGIAIAASSDGALYLAGAGAAETVFDPGPPPVQRWLDSNGGGNFVLKLDTNGKAIWARSINGSNVNSLAATADGGVVVAGIALDRGSLVTRFTADGASVWSFSMGGDLTRPLSISAAGNTMVVGGTNSGTADFDPGPAIDPVFGDISFASRFTF